MARAFRLVPYREDQWDATTLYALHFDGDPLPEIERFLRAPAVRAPEFRADLASLLRRLNSIVGENGLYEPLADTDYPPEFRLFRGEPYGLSALVPNRRKKQREQAPVLRLYVVRFDRLTLRDAFDVATPPGTLPGFPILILGGGGVKRVKDPLDDPLLAAHLRHLRDARNALAQRLQDGDVWFSDDRYELRGNLFFPAP